MARTCRLVDNLVDLSNHHALVVAVQTIEFGIFLPLFHLLACPPRGTAGRHHVLVTNLFGFATIKSVADRDRL